MFVMLPHGVIDVFDAPRGYHRVNATAWCVYALRPLHEDAAIVHATCD